MGLNKQGSPHPPAGTGHPRRWALLPEKHEELVLAQPCTATLPVQCTPVGITSSGCPLPGRSTALDSPNSDSPNSVFKALFRRDEGKYRAALHCPFTLNRGTDGFFGRSCAQQAFAPLPGLPPSQLPQGEGEGAGLRDRRKPCLQAGGWVLENQSWKLGSTWGKGSMCRPVSAMKPFVQSLLPFVNKRG